MPENSHCQKIIPVGSVWLAIRIWLIQQTISHYISYNHNEIIIYYLSNKIITYNYLINYHFCLVINSSRKRSHLPYLLLSPSPSRKSRLNLSQRLNQFPIKIKIFGKFHFKFCCIEDFKWWKLASQRFFYYKLFFIISQYRDQKT